VEDGTLRLRAIVISPDGSRMVKSEAYGIDPVNLGTALANELIEKGARDILG
jgi:hydroxymethylbilane synthase